MWKLNKIIYRCSIYLGSFPSLSFPKPSWGNRCIPACQPGPTAVAMSCIGIVRAGFSRAQNSPHSCSEKTLAILEFLSGWGGADRRVLGWSQLLPTHSTSSAWAFETGSKVSSSKEWMWEMQTPELGGGGQRRMSVFCVLLWTTTFRISFISIRAIT